MRLVLDIGNTRTKGGLFHEGSLADTFSLPTSPDTVGWHAALNSRLGEVALEDAGITSVVPAITPVAEEVVRTLFAAPTTIVTHHLRLPFHLAYTTPETLGSDRLAAAAAAWKRYGTPAGASRSVIAIDAGTTITYEFISADGTYRGGIIGPGPAILREALCRGTAQLPEVPLTLPQTPVGPSTAQALQSGIMHAFLDSAEGMIQRLIEEDGSEAPPLVVVTGGWGKWLRERISAIDCRSPHLVLYGIDDILSLNETAAT